MYERRQMVMRKRLKGLTFRQIAKELGVGVMTVRRDLQSIKEHNAAKVSQFERDQQLGDSLQTYDLIHQEAWDQYHRCANGSEGRARFLNLIRAAESERVKVLMEVGLIGKAAVQVEHRHKADEALEGLTKDAQQLIAMALLKAQLRPPGEPVLELSGGNGDARALSAGKVIEATAEATSDEAA
jgi:predicted ArsR family transcriptional regulator